MSPQKGEDTQAESYIIRSSRPPVKYPDISFAQYLHSEIGTHDPSIVALINLVSEHSELTYGELQQQSQEFASALLQLGVAKGDFVTFYSENNIEYVVALLGTIYLGLAFCNIPPTSGPFELTEQIRQTNATVLVCGSDKVNTVEKALNDDRYSSAMNKLKVLVQLECDMPCEQLVSHLPMAQVHSFGHVLELGSGKLLQSIPHFKIVDLSREHFFTCFTSGTTGVPKGAIHSHRSFLASQINTNMGPKNPGEKGIIWHPIGHISGTFMILYNLRVAKSIVLSVSGEIEILLEAVQRHKLNHLSISANQAVLLANFDYRQKYDLRSLFLISHSGSKIAPNVIERIMQRYGVLMLDSYAATEFFGSVGDRDFAALMNNFETGNLGTVAPNVEMKIVDMNSASVLPPKQSGEICFRGEACFIGYLNNEEATKATIDQDGWYHSGDVGHCDEKGNLFVTDRIKEMIKYKLYSLIPAEIEDFLHRHNAVAAVCVVGVPHQTDGNLIRAYVQLVEEKSLTEQELIDYVKDNMGFQKRLRAGVRFIAKMPRTLIGKIDRQYFKRLVKDELLTEIVP